MQSAFTIKKPVALLFIACAVALLLADVFMAQRIAQLQRLSDLNNSPNVLKAGDAVPALVGYDMAGKKVGFAYGADPRETLLLVLSPACHACDDNWPNWDRLIKGLDNKSVRLIIANIANNVPVTEDYLNRHEIKGIPLLSQVTAESLEAYRLGYTPQTILISREGRVKKLHTGALDGSDFASIFPLVQASDGTIR